jgi:glyoxylase-like metal-dependent hydrolase (beta-lactamase superfamily II)
MNSRSLVVDPGDSGSDISRFVPSVNTDIFLTHGHFDHIAGVPDLCRNLSAPRIFASEADSDFFAESGTLKTVFRFVKGGDLLKFEGEQFEVIGLSGHTKGSLGLYNRAGKFIFVGDTLFRGAVGSVDSRGAFWDMIRAIRESLLTLPNDTLVLPGHGPETTIGHEKRTNPFLVGDS